MKNLAALIILFVLGSTCFSSTAHACSPNTHTPIGEYLSVALITAEGDLPANFRLFTIDSRDFASDDISFLQSDSQGAPTVTVPSEVDRKFFYGVPSYQGTVIAYKPALDIEPGAIVKTTDCHGCAWLRVGEADVTPPPRPEVSSLKYSAFPDKDEECLFGLLGNLSIEVAPRNTAPESGLLALVYTGSSAEQANQATQPLLVEVLEQKGDRVMLPIHQKTASQAPEEGFCLSLEYIDGAYNRSERSEAVCWEGHERPPETTPDNKDSHNNEPHDVAMDHDEELEETCNMTASRKPTTSPAWLALLGLLVLAGRFQKRETT